MQGVEGRDGNVPLHGRHSLVRDLQPLRASRLCSAVLANPTPGSTIMFHLRGAGVQARWGVED